MKRWMVLLFLLFAGVAALAGEAQDAYRAYLLMDEAYAKQYGLVQTQKAELDKLGESLSPGYAQALKTPPKEAAEKAAMAKMMQTVDQSPEFRKLAMEYSLNGVEMMRLEQGLCAQATDPAAVALIKEHFVKGQSLNFNSETVPKKEIPGSPAFQHAMYVADKVKEEGAAKQKWPVMHAAVWLMQNLKQVAFDDPAYRQAYYQTQITQLAAMKKRMEIEQANPELADKIRLARQAVDPAKPETQKDLQQYNMEKQQIVMADPEYQKLNEANRLATLAEMQALDAFAEKSDLPQATEYRAFKAAITAPAK